MRAAVVTSFDKPLRVEDIPRPEPGEGQIRVRTEASGLCHADIHASRGDWPVKPDLPFVPGHEAVGVVAKLGAGVTQHAMGDRVAVPWLGHACGVCEYCLSGRETLCETQLNTGYSINGGHAQFLLADARYAVHVPDMITPYRAAPLTCAGLTSYKAIKVGGVTPGDRVAIFGIGGLGHLALQYAQIFGGETIAVDLTNEKLALAKRLGAHHVINASMEDPVEAIEKLGGADVAVVLAADPKVMEQAHASLRTGGRLILVSMPRDDAMSLPVFRTVLKGIQVIGSVAGTRADLAEVFRLQAVGRTQVSYEIRPLRGINDAIDEILSGRVLGRLVIVP